jgi:hypothetical protein
MVHSFLTLVRCYADLLNFWNDCADKQCRRSRRCRDRSGQCWNTRYPRTGAARERARARIRSKRRALPAALKNWQRCTDPSDVLL